MKNNKTALVVTKEELSLVENNTLNEAQLSQLLKHTPSKYVKKRPAKGGGTWNYVTGGYVKKCLNLMFGWDWDFEIVDHDIMIEEKEVIVKGRLTCRSNGRTIVKMQFGNKEIMFRKQKKLDLEDNPVKDEKGNFVFEPSNVPLSIGNDMKAAATDCLKKCAAEIGIAADIYNPEEFREVSVKEITLKDIKALFDEKGAELVHEDQLDIERVIETKEENSYKKVFTILNKL